MQYVMSDLHGRWDLYSAMLEQIGFSPGDRLYILGDVVDRNYGGIRIFRDILDRPNVQLLLGNHEHMMHRALTSPEERRLNGKDTNLTLWYRNGGKTTQEEWDREPEAVRMRILERIESLPLNLTAEAGGRRFLLCHASPVCMFRSHGFFYPDELEFAVWHRLEPWMNIQFPADVLICGHTPAVFYSNTVPMEITRIKENVYDIDCGCARNKPESRLACLRLEDMKAFYCASEKAAEAERALSEGAGT